MIVIFDPILMIGICPFCISNRIVLSAIPAILLACLTVNFEACTKRNALPTFDSDCAFSARSSGLMDGAVRDIYSKYRVVGIFWSKVNSSSNRSGLQ